MKTILYILFLSIVSYAADTLSVYGMVMDYDYQTNTLIGVDSLELRFTELNGMGRVAKCTTESDGYFQFTKVLSGPSVWSNSTDLKTISRNLSFNHISIPIINGDVERNITVKKDSVTVKYNVYSWDTKQPLTNYTINLYVLRSSNWDSITSKVLPNNSSGMKIHILRPTSGIYRWRVMVKKDSFVTTVKDSVRIIDSLWQVGITNLPSIYQVDTIWVNRSPFPSIRPIFTQVQINTKSDLKLYDVFGRKNPNQSGVIIQQMSGKVRRILYLK